MMNRIIRGLVFGVVTVGLGLGGVGCSSSAPFHTQADRLTISAEAGVAIELPAEFIEYEIILDVMINGTGPHRMIFDTGSAVSQVPPEVAKAAGIEKSGSVRTLDAHGGVHREPIGIASRVEIGGLLGFDVPFTIDRLPEHIAQESNIIGIIGYNMMTKHTLTLDYPNEQVFVSNDRLKSGEVGTIPMWLENGRVPFIGMELILGEDANADPIDTLIDTGSGALMDLRGVHSIIYTDKLNHQAQVGASMSASGSIKPVEYARLNHDIDFNGLVVRHLMAIVDESFKNDTSIGGDFLRRFKVSLDPIGKHIRFELTDERTEIDMPVWRVHGFQAGVDSEKRFVVKSVNEGSQAEIGGLRAGDVLLEFDGEPIMLEPYNWPGPTLDAQPTGRVFLVLRDGEEFELHLQFQDLLPVSQWYRVLRESSGELGR